MTDTPKTHLDRRGRTMLALAAAGLLVVGGGAGAALVGNRPSVEMAPATPVAIRALASDSIVTIRGRVAEVYGNKFILADPSGRALVDTGREGDRQVLATAGQTVTVQGRFDDGVVHASFLVGADNKVVALRPLDGPGHDRGPGAGRPGHDGPGRDGPDGPGGPGRESADRGGPDGRRFAPPVTGGAAQPAPATGA
jgi:hypothetical protein